MAITRSNPSPSVQPHRALRVAVILGGRLLDERVVTAGEEVSVGRGGQNTFCIDLPELPRRQVLFQQRRGRIWLCFEQATHGLVRVEETELSLEALRQQRLARPRGDRYRLELTERSRGKLELGELTILFQLVIPPEKPEPPRLPSVARGGWVKSINWPFTALVSTSLVVHVCLMVSFKFTELPPAPTWAQLPDRFVDFIMPLKKPKPVEEQTATTAEPATVKKPPKKPSKKIEEPTRAPVPQAQRKADMKRVVSRLGMMELFQPGAGANHALSQVFENQASHAGLAQAFAGVRSAVQSSGIGELARRGGSAAAADIGMLTTGSSELPRHSTGNKDTVVVSGKITTLRNEVAGSLDAGLVASVVKRRVGAIRLCYERALKRHPDLAGRLVLSFVIDENGRVDEAWADGDLASSEVSSCAIATIRRLRFPAPEQGTVEASFPFVFAPASSGAVMEPRRDSWSWLLPGNV